MPSNVIPKREWSDFEREVRAFGRRLSDKQEQLGREFERPLYANLWNLYARDKPALWFWEA